MNGAASKQTLRGWGAQGLLSCLPESDLDVRVAGRTSRGRWTEPQQRSSDFATEVSADLVRLIHVCCCGSSDSRYACEGVAHL